MSPSIDNTKCVLVTGATSGIGRALALAIASLPSHLKVIGLGRRKDRLVGLAEAGIDAEIFDVNADKAATKTFVEEMIRKYPEIDTLVLAAGIQREVHFKTEVDLEAIATEMHVNYFSILTMISFFMPHLSAKSVSGHPCLIAPVTSGLAYLEDTSIGVIEISPPLGEFGLTSYDRKLAEGTTGALSQFWMPLEEYTKETIEGLRRGVNVVCSGMSKSIYEKFEQPEEQIITKMAKRAATHSK
ncbi:hypothetical protein F5876DRAFT_87031 [Lentinula aff. lateritia]|uniref:Uncharacterized protein n=1 Tax=Lentinula aff. lateritia TaxID=2804960 RepID=A0ACC1U967_9AGAR|nr:hypothetical protein F5876DRAFT_87031 [Lentinula aff. lateritia]